MLVQTVSPGAQRLSFGISGFWGLYVPTRFDCSCCHPCDTSASDILSFQNIKKSAGDLLEMDSIKAKLDREKQNPEDAAKMDAEIRENKRSVGARAMVEAVKAAQAAGKTKEEIEVELKAQKEEYPRLFAMVLDPRHSPAMLYAMLAQLESVERGARTTHDASVAVGTILVNSFVRPKLGMEPVPLPDSAAPPARR